MVTEQLLQLLETHSQSLDVIRGQMASFQVVISSLMHTHPDRAALEGTMKIAGSMGAKILCPPAAADAGISQSDERALSAFDEQLASFMAQYKPPTG